MGLNERCFRRTIGSRKEKMKVCSHRTKIPNFHLVEKKTTKDKRQMVKGKRNRIRLESSKSERER